MTFYRNLYTIVSLVSILGALNWGAYAYGNNIIEKIGNTTIEHGIYYLFAVSAIISLIFFIYIGIKGWPSSESYQQMEREKQRKREKESESESDSESEDGEIKKKRLKIHKPTFHEKDYPRKRLFYKKSF